MHSWARWAVISIILALSASVAPPARASFGDCEGGGSPEAVERAIEYLRSFDSRIESRLYQCVERLRVPVSTPSGPRHIRIIHDFNAEWITGSGVLPEFDRGVRAAAEAVERLGGVALNDITVFLLDNFPPPDDAERFGAVAAERMFQRGPQPGDVDQNGECGIVVYLGGPGGRPEHAATSVAHEIFHCVQGANLSPERMRSGRGGAGGGGDWWLEGSAEWFVALALPDVGPLADRIDAFDSTSATMPLNRMAYHAVVFFLWLGQDSSPARVMDFLRSMATSPSEGAQRAAMAAALSQDGWVRFAQAYLDRDIRHPRGTDLDFAEPAQGDIWEWSATQTRTAPLEPFVLHRGVVAFQCGRWRTSVRPAPMHSARPEDGGDWNALPAEIDTTSGSGGNYRLAAINATAANVTLTIVGTMEAGCGDCLGVTTTDACLFGTWQLTGGGSIEWMRSRGIPITSASMENATMTFHRDGAYVTGAMEGRMRTEYPRMRADGQGRFQGGGRWSTRDGVLNMCADMQALSGQVTVTNRHGTRTMPVPPVARPGNASSRYSCSGNTLSTEIEMPGYPPMRSQYTRTGE